MEYYLEKKKEIPTDSYWFKTKLQFQNWVLANSHEITLALNTGTPLSPKSIKVRCWFEEECVDVILSIFDHFISKKQWESGSKCIEILVYIVEKIGSDFYDDVGDTIIHKVQNAIRDVDIISKKSSDDENRKGQLAIIDSLGRLGVGAQVSLLRYLDKRTCKIVASEIKKVKWTSNNSIYNTKLPGKILSSLESTAKQYKTEILIEGQQISPEWYLITVTTQQYLFELKKYFEFLKSLHENIYKKNVEDLINGKKYLQAAHLIERWLEFTNKLQLCGWRLQKLMEECDDLRKVKDLPWVSMDFEKEKTILQTYDKEAVDKLVCLLPILSSLPQTNLHDLPDYFGQAYTFGVEVAYKACHDNDAERFKRIFPAIFLGALATHDVTRKEVQGWTQDGQIICSTESLEDLLNVSGFAKLYAELYQNPDLWNICETVWGKYLEHTDARDFITFLTTLAQYRDNKFVIMPKATLRANWDIQFRQKLEEMGFTVDPLEERLFGQERVVNHISPLIRVVGRRSDLLPVDARDIFFVTYLSKHQSARGIDFPDRRDFKQQIEDETASPEDEHQEHVDDEE